MSNKCITNTVCFSLIGLTSFVSYQIVQNWGDFEGCHRPIQITLLLTTIYMALLFSLLIVLDPPCCESRVWNQKCAKILYFWFLGPFSVYIFIHGAIWNADNSRNPDPVCPIIATWIILGALFLSVIQYIWSSMTRIILWMRMRRNVRRVQLILNDAGLSYTNNSRRLLPNLSDSSLSLYNRIGLDSNEITMVKKRVYNESFMNQISGEQDCCAVCVEHFKEGDQIAALPRCNHLYHPTCINNWLTTSPLCPLCRANVRTNLLNRSSLSRTR